MAWGPGRAEEEATRDHGPCMIPPPHAPQPQRKGNEADPGVRQRVGDPGLPSGLTPNQEAALSPRRRAWGAVRRRLGMAGEL